MLKNDESPLAVGKRLKMLRAMAGLNREALANKAEVSMTSISYWEHGKVSPMTARSMGKVIKALEESGVKCSEEWLKTGNAADPTLINQYKKEIQTDFDLHASPFIEEIKLFLSNYNTSDEVAVTKVTHNAMFPIFQEDDIIGGIFLPAESVDLSKEKICIVKIDNKLDVRRVRKSGTNLLFNLSYFSYIPNFKSPFEINDTHLDFIAPIVRLWR